MHSLTIFITKNSLDNPVTMEKTKDEVSRCFRYNIEEALKKLQSGRKKQVLQLVLTTDRPKKGG
jgi:hypothetical protein